MHAFLIAAGSTFGGLLLLTVLLSASGRLGAPVRRIASAFTRAPLLDLMVSTFTWIPWLAFGIALGWRGLIGAIVGEIATLFAWVLVHELAHREAARGPRIVKFINREVGRWRNHAALWVTSIALPGFLFIRFLELACYPMLVLLLDFPRYKQSEWVNVSRQKFDGLVGHDLIWCLYCDWMTGVYSLGAEMLRNVESFWCPIRFYDGKKCDNCKLDFPDIAHGWVAPNGTMSDVEQTLDAQYGNGNHAWFGHPTRITVHGRPVGEANGNGDSAPAMSESPAGD
jgi:hypothetical protein